MRLTSKQSKALANLSKAGVVNAFFRISATADGRYATVERDFSASGPVFVSNDDLILLEGRLRSAVGERARENHAPKAVGMFMLRVPEKKLEAIILVARPKVAQEISEPLEADWTALIDAGVQRLTIKFLYPLTEIEEIEATGGPPPIAIQVEPSDRQCDLEATEPLLSQAMEWGRKQLEKLASEPTNLKLLLSSKGSLELWLDVALKQVGIRLLSEDLELVVDSNFTLETSR